LYFRGVEMYVKVSAEAPNIFRLRQRWAQPLGLDPSLEAFGMLVVDVCDVMDEGGRGGPKGC